MRLAEGWLRRVRRMSAALKGLGLSWRPELALAIERDPRVAFVEVTAEDVEDKLPPAVEALKGRKPIVVCARC